MLLERYELPTMASKEIENLDRPIRRDWITFPHRVSQAQIGLLMHSTKQLKIN